MDKPIRVFVSGLLVITFIIMINRYNIDCNRCDIQEAEITTYDTNPIPKATEEDIAVEQVQIQFENEYDQMIYEATKDTEIDPYLAIAISRLETGHYTSSAFINGHNFGGMTNSHGVMSFDSISIGLEKYVNMLKWYYKNGMDTPDKMRLTYCPPNEDWANIVSSIYNEYK